MKKVFIILACFLLIGCASTKSTQIFIRSDCPDFIKVKTQLVPREPYNEIPVDLAEVLVEPKYFKEVYISQKDDKKYFLRIIAEKGSFVDFFDFNNNSINLCISKYGRIEADKEGE